MTIIYHSIIIPHLSNSQHFHAMDYVTKLTQTLPDSYSLSLNIIYSEEMKHLPGMWYCPSVKWIGVRPQNCPLARWREMLLHHLLALPQFYYEVEKSRERMSK